MDFESELRSAVGVFGASEPAGAGAVWQIVRNLIARASELITVTPEQAEAIIAAALKLYDEKIAPIDIPNIGPIIESFVDAQLRVVLEATLRRILASVN